ncbi:hypothetical protein [Mycolicibacterium sp.]|uniref:hypothetical protein n=1 Tax=Mycolicibacterium sp. TaxID=2320850 RepID=UPI001A1D253F|nr:hypothetical protein [Mycolicibacterium sp.]MBJ7340965.1 hypothetical protein [Mycolicibacterium sp.]
MGRHRRSTESGSAANYVGRVGALALALGVGVMIAEGAGVARADSTSESGAASGGAAQPSTEAVSAAVDSPKGTSSSVAPSSPTVPKMELGGSDGKHVDSADPDSATDAIAGLPHRKPTLVTDRTFGDGRPSTSPMRYGPTTRSRLAVGASPEVTGSTTVGTDTATVPRAVAEPAVRLVDASDQPSSTVVAPQPDPPAREAPIATMVPGPRAALGATPAADTGDAPVGPIPVGLAVLQLIRRDIEDTFGAAAVTTTSPKAVTTAAVVTPAAPSPTDVAQTPYGDVGPWLLQPNGQIANYGGVPHDGKTVLEPINVIIIDPTATSSAQSTARLNAAMAYAGFPAQPIHSTGFLGNIDGTTYGQQPSGFLQAFSDQFFLFTNDHGRMFGPAPATNGTGYVWTGAFSTEQLNPANPLTHEYVSSEIARAELARRLVASGRATVVGYVPLGNAYDDGTFTTGDHDGYAVVLQLTPVPVTLLPTGGLLGAACGHVPDLPGPIFRQVAKDVCAVASSISTALGLRSII